MTDIPELFEDLIASEPALAEVRRIHVADNDEILPHVLMADITRWLCVHGPQPEVLTVLEDHLVRGGPQVRDVIFASFLENLEVDDLEYEPVRNALGPGLRAALAAHEAPPHLDRPI